MSYKPVRTDVAPSSIPYVAEFILQRRMIKKIMALELKDVDFNVEKFKELYLSVVLDMSVDRMKRLEVLTDETEIVNFLRKKGNNPLGSNQETAKIGNENTEN